MLLIMCQCGANRYAVDSRHVSEVLPHVNLHPLGGAPAWLAGMAVSRGAAIGVIDLCQLAEGRPCADRLNSRIILMQADIAGSLRKFGLLAENVGLREVPGRPAENGEAGGPAAMGTLCLDEEGVFQLVDISRLLPSDRQHWLFADSGRTC